MKLANQSGAVLVGVLKISTRMANICLRYTTNNQSDVGFLGEDMDFWGQILIHVCSPEIHIGPNALVYSISMCIVKTTSQLALMYLSNR